MIAILTFIFVLFVSNIYGYDASTLGNDSWQQIYDGNSTNRLAGTEPPSGIVAYSGGALDSANGKIYLFGGGHYDYSGNDVWVFNLATNTWSREYAPDMLNEVDLATCQASVDQVNYPGMWVPSGRPISRHTYYSVNWSGSNSRLLAGGGSTWSASGEVFWQSCYYNAPYDVWSYTPTDKSWEWKGSKLLTPTDGEMSRCQTVPSDDDLLWCFWKEGGLPKVASYRVSTDTWARKSPSGTAPYVENVPVYDSKRNRLWLIRLDSYALQNQRTQFYDIATNSWGSVTTSGPDPGAGAYGGLAYDSANDVILYYKTGGINIFNPNTNTWSASSAATEPTGIPEPNGRFMYDPVKNVIFMVLKGADSYIDVWAYRYATQNQTHKNMGSPKSLAQKPGA